MDGQMLFEMLGGEQHREICMHPSLCAICSLGPAGAGPDVALEADAGAGQPTKRRKVSDEGSKKKSTQEHATGLLPEFGEVDRILHANEELAAKVEVRQRSRKDSDLQEANEYLKQYNRNTHKVAKLYEGLRKTVKVQ